jgi:hypothetical protein
MVEVFKTNISCAITAGDVIAELQAMLPRAVVNFDLEDCDRILRVKGDGISCSKVIKLLERKGFLCEELE